MNPVYFKDLNRLVRLPLVVTALGDPVAGFYLAGGGDSFLPCLGVALASALLYMGGMVLNDVFDLEVDRVHHPRRVLPSEAVSPARALQAGAACLAAGVTAAAFVHFVAGVTALILSAAILFDNLVHKRFALVGCLTMGICRGMSLLMGIHAAVGFSPPTRIHWAVVLHAVYIASITALSLLEDREGALSIRRAALRLIPALLVLLAAPILLLSHYPLAALAPLAFLAVRILWAIRPGTGGLTRQAVMRMVRMGVRGILLLDAAYLWGIGGWLAGSAVFVLYLISHLSDPDH